MFNRNLPWLSDNEGEWAAPSNNPSWIQRINKLNLAQQLGGYPQQTQPAVMPQGGGWDDFVPTQPWNWANNDGLSSGMPGQYQGSNMPNSPTFNYGNPGMFQGFQQPGMYPPQQMQQPMMPQGPRVRADIQEAADRWASGQATAAELQHYGNAPKTQQGFIDRWTDMAGRGKFPGETATSAYVNGSGQQVNAPWMPQRDTAGVSNAPPTRYPQFTGFDGMFGYAATMEGDMEALDDWGGNDTAGVDFMSQEETQEDRNNYDNPEH